MYTRVVHDGYNGMVLRGKYPYNNIRNIDVLTINVIKVLQDRHA